LTEQLGRIGFYSNSVQLPIQQVLAETLGRISGKNDYRLFLCNSGAEANENALKLASFHTGRQLIVAFRNAFHGRTSLAVAATDNPLLQAPVNASNDVVFLPFNDEEALSDCFRRQGDQIAAVIVEGIQGVGGIHEAAQSFLSAIRNQCDQYGAVYIADGIQCGYGRSGQFFSHDWAGVSADIYTTAKGMGNGFPVAGVWIAPHFKARHGMLGTTFGGNPLACAAALAVAEVIAQERLMEHAAAVGAYLRAALQNLPGVQAVRGRGLMIGVEMQPDYAEARKRLLFEQQVFTGEAKPHVIRLLPSLALSMEEAQLFIQRFTSVL
jgi:acetylornithine aminotransferase